MRSTRLITALLCAASPLLAQRPVADSIRPGQFDLGKMWTFEHAPSAYFSQAYGFQADSAWFTRARLAALRIPGCSAAFVSQDGLIVTNHHCVRGAVNAVSRPGEFLLDSGFVAATLADERRLPGMIADQLIAALDVTADVNDVAERAPDGAAREEARRVASAAVQARLKGEHAQAGDSVMVQLVPLYNGARTSAYVFKRYTDVRLVVAAELGVANIGGDWDNFTYPRYALDFAVMRAYGADGQPVRSPHHFLWGGTTGVKAGDAIFLIGSPGATRRLTTISQLEFQRDVALPVQNRFLAARIDAMKAFRAESQDDAARRDVLVQMLGLSNAWKPIGGRLEGLRDASIMGRRTAIERELADSIAARPALKSRYRTLFTRMAALQRARVRMAAEYAAFNYLANAGAGSTTLQRAYWTWRTEHGPSDSVDTFRQRAARVRVWPSDLERRFLALSLDDIARAFGAQHAFTKAALGGGTSVAAAANMMSSPAASAALMDAIMPAVLKFETEQGRLNVEESALGAQIGQARFAVFGVRIPPDGSLSPRIADGVVQGYEYNGTLAPPHTTFFGMYDRNRSHGNDSDWELPYRWRTPPAGLDLGAPLNFISTADSYGGNSGSPAVTRDLRVVGLNFDRNINALVRDYIYLPERGRNVMVDARAIQAALGAVYHADRVVQELATGRRP